MQSVNITVLVLHLNLTADYADDHAMASHKTPTCCTYKTVGTWHAVLADPVA